MCGIAGFCGLGSRVDLENMSFALKHRGPDGRGTYIDLDSQVYFTHQRLSVIDPADGHQPMQSKKGAITVTYNGEIYNSKELRLELEKLGHVFVTDHSDTEVLIHGYEEWGVKLPNRLNGMFAFSIYDKAKKKIFMARDRFGEKPVYWSKASWGFLFASELRALSMHSMFSCSVNELALQKLLAYGFIPAPFSYYEKVQKLPAGHFLIFDIVSQSVNLQCYWSFRIESEDNEGVDETTIIEEFSFLLQQAVERRMVSDVPLGIFLSGGLDSGSIAYFASEKLRHENNSRQLKSFSIGFNEQSYDESIYADQLASLFQTEHCCEKFSSDELLNLQFETLSQLDEPMGDPSLLPTYALSRMTRKHVTVALSGDGGDELLAGYDTFAALEISNVLEKFMPNGLRKGILSLLDLLPISRNNMSLDFKLRRGLLGLGDGSATWNPKWLAPLTQEFLQELLQKPVHIEDIYGDAIEHWNNCASDHLEDKTSEFYVRFYLQDNILTKVDRASMRNSLETRAVFLDIDLVNLINLQVPFRGFRGAC